MNIFTTTNSCAGIALDDCDELNRAAERFLDARNVVIKIAESFGDAASWAGGHVADAIKDKLGIDVEERLQAIIGDLLWNFQNGAMAGLDKKGGGDRWEWLHKGIVVASGISGGFFGLPGLLWDLPITTGSIMRSVADIARSYPDEDISSDDTKRACIEVLATGSPLVDDDDAELGYWTARLGLNHASVELLIKAVAARFGATLSEKLLAQAVPIAGAVAGGALNYAFIDYYQELARVHFAVRGVERRAPDSSAVRPCFSAVVREIKSRRRVGSGQRHDNS